MLQLASCAGSALMPLYVRCPSIEVHDCMAEMARSVANAHVQTHRWALNTMQATARLPRVSTAALCDHVVALLQLV